jgi:hypothetical protein
MEWKKREEKKEKLIFSQTMPVPSFLRRPTIHSRRTGPLISFSEIYLNFIIQGVRAGLKFVLKTHEGDMKRTHDNPDQG